MHPYNLSACDYPEREDTHHLALANTSQTPGRGGCTFPTVAISPICQLLNAATLSRIEVYLACTSYQGKSESDGTAAMQGGYTPIHRKFVLISGLYGSYLWKALHNFHSSIELCVNKLVGVHVT